MRRASSPNACWPPVPPSWTALIESVVLGDGGPNHRATAQALLDAGADPHIPDRTGATPLQLAEARGFAEMAALIRAGGVYVNRLRVRRPCAEDGPGPIGLISALRAGGALTMGRPTLETRRAAGVRAGRAQSAETTVSASSRSWS